jgi:hypothetical protein
MRKIGLAASVQSESRPVINQQWNQRREQCIHIEWALGWC